MLSDAQASEFDRNGYVVIDDVLTPEAVERLREAVAAPEVRAGLEARSNAEKGVHLFDLTAKDDIFKSLARDPRLVERVGDLLGPNLHLHHSKLATKPPKKDAGIFPWHQDFNSFPHTNTDLLAINVLLDDATPANGCMYMVPGSHKLGLLPHDSSSGQLLTEYLWELPGSIQKVAPRAGGISLHHCLTAHYSPNNLSGRDRRSLIFQYRAADAIQLTEGIFSDTGFLVRGEDPGTIRLTDAVWDLRGSPARVDLARTTGERARSWNAERTAQKA